VNALRAVSSLGLNNQLASQLTNLQASNAALAFPGAAGAAGPASAQTLFFRTQNGSILAPAAGSQALLTGLAGIQSLAGLGALPNGVHHTGQTVTGAGSNGSNQHQSQLINSQTINLNNQRLAYAAAHRQAQALNNLAAVQHHLNQTNIQVAQQQAQALNLQNHLATLAAFSAAQQQQQPSPQQASQNQAQQSTANSSYLSNPSSSTHSPQSSHVSNSSQTATNTSNTNLLAASLLQQQRPAATGLQIQGGYT
jgi:hypothetical protein